MWSLSLSKYLKVSFSGVSVPSTVVSGQATYKVKFFFKFLLRTAITGEMCSRAWDGE